MNYTIERTDEHIVVRFPKAMNDQTLLDALDHLFYLSTQPKKEVTQAEVDELAREAKSGWWEGNKARFKGQPGFEWMEEE